MTIEERRGFALITLLITIFFVTLIGIATTQLVLSNLRQAHAQRHNLQAQFAADAAVDHALQEVNQDEAWTGIAETTFYEDDKALVTYESEVTDGSDDFTKFISATGRTYAPKTNTQPTVTRKYLVELRGVGGGSFSVVTGVGGLEMRNHSKIVGGNVFINGSLYMENSAQIGLTSNLVSVKAAHQSCPVPADASYPSLCTSAEGQPITIVSPARIYGDVIANNQTDGSRMSSGGLVDPCVPEPSGNCVDPLPLPTHNRGAQIADVVGTPSTGGAESCNSGSRTWPANFKIEGDVQIRNTCKVTVEGDVWITGKLELRNSGQLIVSNTITDPDNTPVVMIDGQNGLDMSNSGELVSNTSSIGFRAITYWSRAACSPDCPDVTGPDLYNSRNDVTIRIDNSAKGPNTEFYARWTKLTLSNSGNIGAVVGQTVELTNSASITFGASVSGVSEPSAWLIRSYKRVFN